MFGAQRHIDNTPRFGYIREVVIGFIRLVFYLILAYLVYIFLRSLFRPNRPSRRPANHPPSAGTMVKDEMCSTYLPREEAILEKVGGKEHYFCSEECRQKFLDQKSSRL